MSVTDTTPRGQTDTLSLEVELPHAPEKVWRALTDPALLAEWLLPVVEGELAAGAAFTFQTQPFPGWDGTVRCQVLEREPPRRLRYSWTVGDLELDTIVTFTLTPTAAGTRLVIAQAGFQPAQKQNFGGARYGWKMMAGKLIELLAAAPPPAP
ncbi:MAG: SRPBCC domain-containing protein [Kofleriaceae bacterium]|nr:SRPBCC domain-containing protein [Kofleriaceae bacterium]MCL4226124.1 SRPBCC domain-containing protein [Myxococcales bacterium]